MGNKDNDYVVDLAKIIVEKANEIKASETELSDYDLGRLMALHEVISLMKDQADLFDVDIGLDDYNEFDLL